LAVDQSDSSDKTETYEILRRPEVGRKDIFRRAEQDEKAVAELDLPSSGELDPSDSVVELAPRVEPGAGELETAGIVDGNSAENLPLRGPSRSARPARRWFSCNFIRAPDIIVRWCGWIDLVAPSPAAKVMTNRFGDRQPKRTL
jgi:hypothetical protein